MHRGGLRCRFPYPKVQSVFKTVPKAALVNPPLPHYIAMLMRTELMGSRIWGTRTPNTTVTVLYVTYYTTYPILVVPPRLELGFLV